MIKTNLSTRAIPCDSCLGLIKLGDQYEHHSASGLNSHIKCPEKLPLSIATKRPDMPPLPCTNVSSERVTEIPFDIESLDGVAQIAAERKRHQKEEGFSPEDDCRNNTCEELAKCAAYYAHPDQPNPQELFPKEWQPEWKKRFKHSRIKQLRIAGALCAAEIDRLKSTGGK